MNLKNLYTFERWGLKNGIFIPTAKTRALNIVPTQGLNEDQKQIWTTSAVSRALYVGLITTLNFGSVQLTDIAAKIVTGVPGGGDNQWREFVGYSEANRQVLTMGAAVAGAIDNSASQAVFTVTVNFTLQGGFVATSNVKGGTAGLLIGDVSAPSSIPFTIGQQVRVTISSTLSN